MMSTAVTSNIIIRECSFTLEIILGIMAEDGEFCLEL